MIVSMAMAVAAAVGSSDTPLFTRAEPALEAGVRALTEGQPQAAIDAFRRAKATTAEQRAMVEYDVASAQTYMALAARKDASQPAGAPAATEDQATALEASVSGFERAYGMTRDPRLKSEAALAAGNAAAAAGKIDDAIDAYRRALVADAKNTRAKNNLLRLLKQKEAEPPPKDDEQGGQDESEESDDQKKDDQGKGQGDQKPDPSQGAAGDEGSQGDESKKDDEKQADQKDDTSEGDEKDPQQSDADRQDEDSAPEQKNAAGQAPEKQEQKPDDKAKKKAAARALLDALRAREKPPTSWDQKTMGQRAAKDGKDW